MLILSVSFIGKNENYISNSNLDTLFYLSVEALVGPDSITYITPKLLNKNNTIITDTTFKQGKFSIGIPIYDIEKASIGVFYPNPFEDYSVLDFSVVKESTISLAIYSIEGRLVSKFPDGDNTIKYILLNDDNQEISLDNDSKLAKGNYRISIDPDSFIFSSGAYFVYVYIDGNILKTNFIYRK